MTNNFMNDLLAKFDQVEIKNESRISEMDKMFCETQQEYFETASQLLTNTLKAFEGLYDNQLINKRDTWSNENGFINEYNDIRPLKERIIKIKSEFIYRITRHFSSNYNVTLDSDKIQEQLKDITVHYDMILDRIFDQLGGFTFADKAVQEIKDKLKENVKYYLDKMKIAKGKMSIPDYIYWDTDWRNNKKTYGNSKLETLFVALSHFETESTDMINYYSNVYKELQQGEGEYCIFEKYELGYNSVKSIKFFKNGKVEIVFNSQELAERFKNEYLLP